MIPKSSTRGLYTESPRKTLLTGLGKQGQGGVGTRVCHQGKGEPAPAIQVISSYSGKVGHQSHRASLVAWEEAVETPLGSGLLFSLSAANPEPARV